MAHLYDQRRPIVHGDLKMLNVVRMGERLQLIDLDAAALAGLRTFYDQAAAHGLIVAAPDLRFYALEDGA